MIKRVVRENYKDTIFLNEVEPNGLFVLLRKTPDGKIESISVSVRVSETGFKWIGFDKTSTFPYFNRDDNSLPVELKELINRSLIDMNEILFFQNWRDFGNWISTNLHIEYKTR